MSSGNSSMRISLASAEKADAVCLPQPYVVETTARAITAKATSMLCRTRSIVLTSALQRVETLARGADIRLDMSDSDDLSTPANIPADSQIEACLRRVVRKAVANDEEITTNLARTKAEEELGLDTGFFKYNEAWKTKSRDIIADAVQNDETPAKPKPTAKAGQKRKSDEAPPQKKRAKKSATQEDSSHHVVSEKAESKARKKTPSSEHDDSSLSDAPDVVSEQDKNPTNGNAAKDDESDFSDVMDDGPPKKKRQKQSTSPKASKAKSNKAAKSTNTKEKPNSASPDDDEIKKLQSWLLKCGIRKAWHRELAPYPTAKEKMRHLKKMLDDVGMTPRYSAEKARQIKEARELKEELEATKEFNEQWGDGEGSDSEGGVTEKKKEPEPPPQRLKPRGLVDLGDSDDESE